MSLGHRPVRIKKSDLPRELLAEDKWLTYNAWLVAGRCVMKGQRSIRRDKGNQPLFSREQTTPFNPNSRHSHLNDDRDEDDPYKDRWLFT